MLFIKGVDSRQFEIQFGNREEEVVAFEVTSNPSDRGALNRSMNQFKEELGLGTIHVTTDKGYERRPDIASCLMNGTVADVVFIYDREEQMFSLCYEEKKITEEIRASLWPEDI